MERAAIIQNGAVANIVVVTDEGALALQAIGMTLVDADPLNLAVGDTTDGVDFYRDGVKLPLPVDDYPIAPKSPLL